MTAKNRGEIVDQLIADIFGEMSADSKMAVATRIFQAVERGLSAREYLAELAAEHPELTQRGIDVAVAVLREIEDGGSQG